MLKPAFALLVAAALILPMTAAPVTDYKEVEKVMDTIPTAAGVSLKKRLKACKVTVHKGESSVEKLEAPAPQYGAKKGQTVLKLVLDFPPPPKQPGPSKPNPQQKNVVVIWIIDGTKVTPVSAWANVLQNRPVPLGYDESNNC